MTLVSIPEPGNLSDRRECVELWGNISRFGVEMDEGRTDWNHVVINSAYELIEAGCVQERRR